MADIANYALGPNQSRILALLQDGQVMTTRQFIEVLYPNERRSCAHYTKIHVALTSLKRRGLVTSTKEAAERQNTRYGKDHLQSDRKIHHWRKA